MSRRTSDIREIGSVVRAAPGAIRPKRMRSAQKRELLVRTAARSSGTPVLDGMKPVVFKVERIEGDGVDGRHVPED